MNQFKVEKTDHGYGVFKQKSSGQYGLEIVFEKKEDAVKYAEGNGKLEEKANKDSKSAAVHVQDKSAEKSTKIS